MKATAFHIIRLILLFCIATTAFAEIRFLSRYQATGAEIFQFHAESQRLYSTASVPVSGVEVIDFSDVMTPKLIKLIDFGQAFPRVGVNSVASVAIDPTDRGLGAVALIPEDSNLHLGKVGLFDLQTGEILGYVEVGYHPDSLTFSPNGEFIYVANEGEFVAAGPQVPGSISLIDLSDLDDFATIAHLRSQTFDFTDGNLADGIDLSGLRSNQPGTAAEIFLEPEYVIGVGDKAFVSIQENNAIGVFDARSKKWTAVHDLLTRTHDIDPSDRDKKAKLFRTVETGRLHHISMPDMIAAYEIAGTSYLLTANEGDARPDGRDSARVQDLGKKGYPPLNRQYKRKLSKLYGPHTFKNANLGRLEISIVDGLNEQGEIVKLHTFGSRSFSILNAGTGKIIYDSASDFELLSARFGGENYNANQESGDFDSRSDKKGPEPEAVTVGWIDGRAYAFIAMERSGFIFIYDITDPKAAHCVSIIDTLGSKGLDLAPEFLQFIPAANSASGQDVLLIGFEVSQTISAFSISL